MSGRAPLVLIPQFFGSLVFDRRTSRYLPFDAAATDLLLALADGPIERVLAEAAGADHREQIIRFFEHFYELGFFTVDTRFAGTSSKASTCLPIISWDRSPCTWRSWRPATSVHPLLRGRSAPAREPAEPGRTRSALRRDGQARQLPPRPHRRRAAAAQGHLPDHRPRSRRMAWPHVSRRTVC